MPVSYRCNLHAHGKTKEGKNIDTKKHFDYICREGKYKNIRNNMGWRKGIKKRIIL